MAKSDRICVGAVAGSFGVRGEVRLKSFCAEPEAIAADISLPLPNERQLTSRPMVSSYQPSTWATWLAVGHCRK